MEEGLVLSSGRRQRRLSRRTTVVAVIAIGIVLAQLAVYTHGRLTAEHDPRAYPKSKLQSLDDVRKYYYIQLPECATDSVRYGGYSQFALNSLYVYFIGDSACISEFLAANGLDNVGTYKVHGLHFRPGREDEFGWPGDPDREYVRLGGTLRDPTGKRSDVSVKVAIDYNENPNRLFLHASIFD